VTSGAPNWVRWSALGLLLLQLGWIVALPPFRGIDEFDHVYRADAVAHGEWVAEPEAATRGTGATLSVTREIVEAARPECQRLAYTGPEDCVGELQGDRVAIASGAGRYNPLFYALVGYPGSLLEGIHALYLMRGLSALMCTLLIAWSLTSLSRWTGVRGPLTVLLTLTPMIVYSTAVVAPNGLEMTAGLGLWVALGGLAHVPGQDRTNLLLAMVSGVLLVSLRSLGPMWALIILGTALLAWPELRDRAPDLAGRGLGRLAIAAGAISGVASVGWILSQRSLVIGSSSATEGALSLASRIQETTPELFIWPLQGIAAFPLRNDPAPSVVYASYGMLLLWIVLGGIILSSRSRRRALLAVVGLSFAIPWVITVSTLTTFGVAWQGRYALPYLLGAAVLAGEAWSRYPKRLGWRATAPAALLVLIGQVAGPLSVLVSEVDRSPLSGTSAWWDPPPVLLSAILVIGALMLTVPLATYENSGRANR
jgi:hypothetical protein